MNVEIIACGADGLLVDEVVVMPGAPLKGVDAADGEQVQGWIRRARTIVAEYARAGGMRDPEAIAEFSRSCVGQALRGMDRGKVPAALCAAAVRIAAQRFGLGVPSSRRRPSAARAKKSSAVRAAGRQSIFVPQQTPQAMPPQPLGELLPVIQPRAWRRLASAAVAMWTGVATRTRDGY